MCAHTHTGREKGGAGDGENAQQAQCTQEIAHQGVNERARACGAESSDVFG